MSSNGDSERYVLSPGGQDLAITSNDGRLSIWDVSVGQLKHEFVPSAHLSASCTCLTWMPISSGPSTPKSSRSVRAVCARVNILNVLILFIRSESAKPPRPSLNGSFCNTRSDTIALGTTTGSVLIYSLKTGDVVIHLHKKTAPHKDRVNDIVSSSHRVFLSSSFNPFFRRFGTPAEVKIFSRFQRRFHLQHERQKIRYFGSSSRAAANRTESSP